VPDPPLDPVTFGLQGGGLTRILKNGSREPFFSPRNGRDFSQTVGAAEIQKAPRSFWRRERAAGREAARSFWRDELLGKGRRRETGNSSNRRTPSDGTRTD